MSKVMGIYVNFTKNHSPNMVMSRDPGFKFREFLFFAYFCIKFQEKLKNLGELAKEQKSYKQKTNWGWKTPPPPPHSAYRVNVNKRFHRLLLVLLLLFVSFSFDCIGFFFHLFMVDSNNDELSSMICLLNLCSPSSIVWVDFTEKSFIASSVMKRLY